MRKPWLAALVMLALTSVDAVAIDVTIPTYIRFTLGDGGGVSGIPLVDAFTLDLKSGRMLMGDFAMPLEHCDEGWVCLGLPAFEFAVPADCNEGHPDGSWTYRKRRFSIVQRLDLSGEDSTRTLYVVDVANSDGSRHGVAVYSIRRGVEAFSYADDVGGVSHQIDYHLVSKTGAADGGCPESNPVPLNQRTRP